MYKKELKYMVINYSDKDLSYIDDLCDQANHECEKIVSFFGLNSFGAKVNVKIWSSLEDFREFYKSLAKNLEEDLEVPKWICGFANGNIVNILSLEEYIKTEQHENGTLKDLMYLVMHEFTHSCHHKFNKPSYFWLGEGLATTISEQYKDAERIFDFTLEQAMYGGRDYRNCHTMFCYVYETYGRDYILELIENPELSEAVTPILYEETKNTYGEKNNTPQDNGTLPKQSLIISKKNK